MAKEVKGLQIDKKYLITGKLAEGSFGLIYTAVDSTEILRNPDGRGDPSLVIKFT
jgi:hypothetical protein